MKRLLWGWVVLGVIVAGTGEAHAQPSYVYTTLDVPGSGDTFAAGINNAGQIVGSYNGSHGFILSGGVYSTLDAPGRLSLTYLTAINDSGQIVGSANTNYHDPRSPDVGLLLRLGRDQPTTGWPNFALGRRARGGSP
jgi:hypothetical protein